MFTFKKNATTASSRVVRCFVSICFLINLIVPSPGFAQALGLPQPGTILSTTPVFYPAMMVGLEVYPDNPFKFDFIINDGDEDLAGDALKQESEKMIKYFLASLTIPEKDLWVNLSPFEQDRIIPDTLAQTDLGRDLLAQDYILKQLTASLIHPQTDLGKKFWGKVYQRAYAIYQTTEIPVDTFNKVWIMPDKVVVYRHGNMAFVAEASLKVMLEEDYLALSRLSETLNAKSETNASRNTLASDIVREIVIPELEKEVNTGKNFASLRQAYNALILGAWFKKNLKESLLGKVYVNRSKVAGIDLEDKEIKQKIYESYLLAYKQGAYNFIRAEYDDHTKRHIPRKYFSGGIDVLTKIAENLEETTSTSPQQQNNIVRDGENTRITTALSTDKNSNSSPLKRSSGQWERKSWHFILEDGANTWSQDQVKNYLIEKHAHKSVDVDTGDAPKSPVMMIAGDQRYVAIAPRGYYKALKNPTDRWIVYVYQRKARTSSSLSSAIKIPYLDAKRSLEINLDLIHQAIGQKPKEILAMLGHAPGTDYGWHPYQRLDQNLKKYISEVKISYDGLLVSVSKGIHDVSWKLSIVDNADLAVDFIQLPKDEDFGSAPMSSAIALSKEDKFPGHRDLEPGQMFFGKYDKLYPLTKNFFSFYGGEKQEYKILRLLASYMDQVQFFVGQTKGEYADVDIANNKITINTQFLDYLFQTGSKKIAMSFIAGLLAQIMQQDVLRDISIKDLEILIGANKKSLLIPQGSRLDDVKAMYQIKNKVIGNDTLEGAFDPYFLSDSDIILFISDMLHRGKILDKRVLVEKLTDEFLIYGKISEQKAQELLDGFYRQHSNIVRVSEESIEDPIANIKAKLDPNTKLIVGADEAQKANDQKNLVYSLHKEYTKDPAFRDRITVWDIEAERQDEVGFGGKTAHTGEMGFIPDIVTLPNFASAGETFQNLFVSNSTKAYVAHLDRLIKQIIRYRDDHPKFALGQSLSEEEVDQFTKDLSLLRVAVETKKGEGVFSQIQDTLSVMRSILDDLQSGSYENLRDYFKAQGDHLDREVRLIKEKKTELAQEIAELEIQKKGQEDQVDINKKISQLEEQLQGKQLEYEKITAAISGKLLIGGRAMIVPRVVEEEMKSNLRKLAQRIGIPLHKLVLAIRSSAVGEDSEAASFAGRQDTYIFVTPFATKKDPEGLDFIITNWIFNQASLFNKRAVDYRFDFGLPTFDEHVEISTLFQEMFLSGISFIGFSVDRETGFPVMTLSATEGQGEMLVSGRETGSQFFMMYDGEPLNRKRGLRSHMIVETPDGLGKIEVEIPDDVKQEFSITDKEVIRKIADYFRSLHEFYGGYVDLEGALRIKRDAQGNMITLKDENGKALLDERGFPRYDWMIVSTQARPETVWSRRDPHKIFMKQILVTDKSFQQAQAQGKVLPFNFIAKTGGVAQGQVFWVLDKRPDTLAQTIGKIMFAEQSDPDMNSAMIAAKGILALKGGPNSHTMIVASEYGLVAITGVSNATFEELQDALPNGVKVTIDANRGKILLGTDYVLQVEGKDFRPIDLPRTKARVGVFAATPPSALKVAPLRLMIDFYGIGLDRQELTLTNDIGIYPDLLLAYDNMVKKEKRQPHEGPVLDRVSDAEKISFLEKAIEGYNSAEDFYTSVLSESILTKSITTVPPLKRVLMHAQTIADAELRVKVLDIIKNYYRQGIGEIVPLRELESIFIELTQAVKGGLNGVQTGSDAQIVSDIVKLLDKRHYIRLDDRKSDEYQNVYGAEEYINREANPMKGFRGLDLMFKNPQTLRWQLKAIKKAIDTKKAKFGIFAPVVRRPIDVVKFLEILDEEGLIDDNIKVGIMTELPTNSINIEDFLAAVTIFEQRSGKKAGSVDFFTSTGGNDGLQTLARVDRNTSNASLKEVVTDYSLSILRWNGRMPKITKKFNAIFRSSVNKIKNAFCGNAPSVKGQENYGAILAQEGYEAVSMTPESIKLGVENLARQDVEIPAEAQQAIGFDFEIDPQAVVDVKLFEDSQFKIGTDFGLTLGFHYKALKSYDEILLPKVLANQPLSVEERRVYTEIRRSMRAQGYVERLDEPGIGMKFYERGLLEALGKSFSQAKTEGKRFIITTDALFSNEYRELLFGELYEPSEANPEYGVHGLVKSLSNDRDFLRAQLSAIKRLVDDASGQEGIVLQLRVVRSFKEIDQVKSLMSEIGLNIPLSVDVEVAANLYEINEILSAQANISEISLLNPLRFTSDLMALERNNINGNDITEKDQKYQLIRPVMILATAAKKAGIPFYVDTSLESYIGDLAHQARGLPPQNKDTELVFYVHPLTGKIVPVAGNLIPDQGGVASSTVKEQIVESLVALMGSSSFAGSRLGLYSAGFKAGEDGRQRVVLDAVMARQYKGEDATQIIESVFGFSVTLADLYETAQTLFANGYAEAYAEAEKQFQKKRADNLSPTGGIDFATLYQDLNIKTDDQGLPLAVQFQDMERIHFDSLAPIIIQMVPAHNLPLILGFETPQIDSAQVVKVSG